MNQNERTNTPADIGICRLDEEGDIIKLQRGPSMQGVIFKSWDAYENRPNDPCYVPEFSESVYTAEDFLDICYGQKEFADELFHAVDWQHPETLFDEWLREDEWVICSTCKQLVNYGDGCDDKVCPNCGTEVTPGKTPGRLA